jgi:RimJ/RimL family protein N-acetyltransferase
MVCRLSSDRGLATLPELETPRLTLRRLQFDDAPFLVRLLNEPSFLENIGDRGVRSIEDAHRYLREGPMAMYDKYGFGLWHTARKDGTPVGMCGLLKRDNLPDVDVGYAFFPEFWGSGFAYEAAAATLRHGARKFGLTRVVGVVSEGNAGSIRVLEKLGMSFERMFSMREGEPEVRYYGRNLSVE